VTRNEILQFGVGNAGTHVISKLWCRHYPYRHIWATKAAPSLVSDLSSVIGSRPMRLRGIRPRTFYYQA
jgi:hypothetical protein